MSLQARELTQVWAMTALHTVDHMSKLLAGIAAGMDEYTVGLQLGFLYTAISSTRTPWSSLGSGELCSRGDGAVP